MRIRIKKGDQMSKSKKKKTTKKRIDRVASAREWIGKYEGENIVRGYI